MYRDRIETSVLLRRGSKLGKFVLVERALGVATRTVDAMMIYFIASDPEYGFHKAFLLGGVWNLALCTGVVALNNHLLIRYGIDLTGLNDFRNWAEHGQRSSRIALALVRAKDWILARRSSIFWIGSWFMIDPDYVTIMLQNVEDNFFKTIATITLPSVALAMVVWTPFYWALIRLTGFADTQFVQWILWLID